MADLRNDPAFSSAVAATRFGIHQLATGHNVPDAVALVGRARGVNNLQGHANSILPLAVLAARVYPQALHVLRARTELMNGLTRGSAAAGDPLIWRAVRNGVQLLIATRGDDIIAEELRGGAPQSIERVAETYLSQRYGGGHIRGGAGDTVIKRTLKLMAHLSIEL